ncbi:MAG: YHS domain-containing (seleno)protein [Planctomycetota bacterium]
MQGKILTASAGLIIVAALSSCSNPSYSTKGSGPISESGPSRAYHDAKNLPSHGVALEGYCPVAYFAVNKPVRGKKEFAATHDDVTYYFVNQDAKNEFVKNPKKYIPAYGGWCAFGMAVEDKFPVDPTNFKIVDGRLMLFLKNRNVDALELWNKDNETTLTQKADRHWRKVQG